MTVSYTDFALRFPALASDDPTKQARINLLIQDAYLIMSPAFYGSLYDLAVLYSVADQVVSAPDFEGDREQYFPKGAITSETVNDSGWSIGYASSGSGSGGSGSGSAASVFATKLKDLKSGLALPVGLGDCCSDYYPIASPVPVPTPSPVAQKIRSAQVLTVSNEGTITDAQSVAIANTGTSAGTAQGQSIAAGMALSWSVVAGQDVLQPISYDATGTTFLITVVS